MSVLKLYSFCVSFKTVLVLSQFSAIAYNGINRFQFVFTLSKLVILLRIISFRFDISKVSKVGDRSRRRPEGSLFNSYYTEMLGKALLLSLDCSTLPLIRTLYCRVLSKEVSSTIFKVFGMTQPGIEPRSPGPFANVVLKRDLVILLEISSSL